MSYELLPSTDSMDGAVERGSEAARQPGSATPSRPPPRGAALSVLWWPETDGLKEDVQRPETD
jgi:hypothetical protein